MSKSATDPAAVTPFAFQPPAGGDVILKSCEGTVFNAHSVLLSLASTVFAGMFASASTADPIDLAEDAETISLMLAFIYPVTPPLIATVDRLEKVMHFSQKYDIAKMIEFVEGGVLPESELIHSDPVRLFRASVKYGFPAIKSLAVKAFRPKHCDVLSPSGLVKLARYFPEASSVIGLIGAQIVRTHIVPKIVTKVFGSMRPRFEKAHKSSSDNHLLYMSCRACWDEFRTRSRDEYTPGWWSAWLDLVERELINEPMHKCEPLFRVTCLSGLLGRVNRGCTCIAQTLTKHTMFEELAQGIKKYVEKELKNPRSFWIMPGDLPTAAVTGPPFAFQPPAGGDLTLQSCDGTTFQVHSVLLGLASTVFAGMLTGETKPDTVELAEDTETISLMLAFIYPVDPPSITTINQVEKIMLSSQKYDIEKMTKFIERCNRPDNQLILSDPIHAFRASIKHDFPTIRTLSAKASGTKHIDPYSLKGLEELARKFPESSSVIGLIGAQLIRGKLLAGLLKGSCINVSLMPTSLGLAPGAILPAGCLSG
ncbi:hypothetical protein FRC11_009993 [Ceratobasidium sp. 423]|nr:hypothetical protein FRC11_009993 [Ceratobasidium sp. 423]